MMENTTRYLTRAGRKLQLILDAKNWREMEENYLESKLDEMEEQEQERLYEYRPNQCPTDFNENWAEDHGATCDNEGNWSV